MVHEQKFKNLLSSTCQVSVERMVLDLESEVMRGPGSITTGGNKTLLPLVALLPFLCILKKTLDRFMPSFWYISFTTEPPTAIN